MKQSILTSFKKYIIDNPPPHPYVCTNNMTTIINNSKTIHFFITGIIRPNVEYLNFLSSKIKFLFSTFYIKLYLLTWDNLNIDKASILNFDYVFFEPQPTDEYIYIYIVILPINLSNKLN